MTVILVIVILVCLILAHEFGHFVAAKLFGIRVDEFGIGFPPRALLFGRIGDTEYTLNWIPFGGFVRLYGEQEDTAEHGKGSLMDSPRWKQGIVMLAGVAMNAVAACALFAVALGTGVPAIVSQLQPNESAQVLVSDVLPGSPADDAGIAAGDQVLSMQDAQGDQPVALTPDALVAFVSSHGGQQLTVTFLHNNATTTATVIPANGVNTQNVAQPAIGVGLVLVQNVALPPPQAMQQAFYTTGASFEYVAEGVWGIIASAFHGAPDLSSVSGPIGLYWVIGSARQSGLGILLETIGLISVSLAVVNVIPVPALDGGKLLVLIVEAITRRRLPRLAIQLLDTIGLALIILLLIAVSYHDIATHLPG